jgi:hypothetical protein
LEVKELAWGSLGTKERMAHFGRLMAQAAARTRSDIFLPASGLRRD